MVRIPLPPADSPSLSRIHFRKSRNPAFRAGVRGWLGDRVGRDAQGVSISRQLAAISLSGHIPDLAFDEGLDQGIVVCIKHPVELDAMLAKVRLEASECVLPVFRLTQGGRRKNHQ